MNEKDLYSVLGVPRTASLEDIKKAYRKLARKHHPDVNPGNKKAEERFKEISEAHDILSDPEKRKLYDEFGMAGVQAGFDAGRARAYREQASAGAWRTAQGPGGFAGFGYTNFEDIFGDIFGEGRGRTQRAGSRPGADLESELEIGLLDAIRGTTTEVTLQRPETCPVCNGTGAELASATICPDCKGQGSVRVGQGPLSITRTCPTCGGQGRVNLKSCGHCGGAGQVPKTERLSVRIPPGVDTGSRIRVEGKGGSGMGAGAAGDLFIRIRVRPHPLLERKGDDLYMEVPITVREAVRGGVITVPTPSGPVRVTVPPGSQSGKQLRVRGRGVPQLKGKERGDLYLRLVVHAPDQETEAVRAATDHLEAGYSRNPREGLKL